MDRRWGWLLPAVWVVVLTLGPCASGVSARSAEASVHLDVPAGEWRSVRLKRIPVGATLSMELRTDGVVALWLLDAAGFAGFPEPETPLFRGKSSDRLSASVRAPSSGDYYVLVDNRDGDAARSVDLRVAGSTGEGEAEAVQVLDLFTQRLGLLFTFEPFSLRAADCPETGAIACPEVVRDLRAELGADAAGNVLLFAIFHRTAHALLAQWGRPEAADETGADELAAALLVVLGRGERLREIAADFEREASRLDAGAAGREELHLPDSERIARLRRLADDPDLARRWQPVLVPRMRTAALEQLRDAPERWTDLARVRRELETRAAAP